MANPKVEIRPVRVAGYTREWVVWCVTGDCEFAGSGQTKTEAQVVQRNHARQHRMRQQERRALNRPEGS